MRGAMTAVTALVSGHHPAGSVTFSSPGMPVVTLPLGAGGHEATFILTKSRQRVTVHYLGDAANAPSSTAARAR